eukprot:6367075-Alexandrium_andersonii.AAC.1
MSSDSGRSPSGSHSSTATAKDHLVHRSLLRSGGRPAAIPCASHRMQSEAPTLFAKAGLVEAWGDTTFPKS